MASLGDIFKNAQQSQKRKATAPIQPSADKRKKVDDSGSKNKGAHHVRPRRRGAFMISREYTD